MHLCPEGDDVVSNGETVASTGTGADKSQSIIDEFDMRGVCDGRVTAESAFALSRNRIPPGMGSTAPGRREKEKQSTRTKS